MLFGVHAPFWKLRFWGFRGTGFKKPLVLGWVRKFQVEETGPRFRVERLRRLAGRFVLCFCDVGPQHVGLWL